MTNNRSAEPLSTNLSPPSATSMRATMTSWEVFNEGKNVSAHLAIMFCCCKNSAEGLTSKSHERGVDPPTQRHRAIARSS